MQIEDRIAVSRHFGGVGLAMKHPQRPAVALGGLDGKPAGHEREQIRRQRRRLRELEDRWRVWPGLPAPLLTACQPSGTVSDNV